MPARNVALHQTISHYEVASPTVMYIHRVVIDANVINTRGNIPAMNRLEALHDAGLIEIFQTSTLPIEFSKWPPGRHKARSYAVIGGSSMVSIYNGNVADSQLGSSAGESRFVEIHTAVFGDWSSVEETRIHSARDSLHIDQANQHQADFFITNENAILDSSPSLAALGITTVVCTPEACLSTIETYFSVSYGTVSLTDLRRRMDQEGPILLGSNSCGGTALSDAETGEVLLAFERAESGVGIRTVIRSDTGARLLTVRPGEPFSFDGPGAKVRMEVGPSPVRLGTEQCRSFAITAHGTPALAGRVLRNGRLLLHTVTLHNSSGRLVFQVERDCLHIAAGAISEHPPR